jgi:hypothetical protein
MEIKPVANILAQAGLKEPQLAALVADENNYKVLLMQPLGDIEASANGVFNRDRALARLQFDAFLKEAQQSNCDLAITPEYSLPWVSLMEALKAGTAPSDGKLWVLGCESIKYQELVSLKEQLAPGIKLLFEGLEPAANRFVGPLAYVFLAPPIQAGAPPAIVVLVQLKTHPMGDADHFETNGLQRGKTIYLFGNAPALRLLTLICADAFSFTDQHAQDVYDRSLDLSPCSHPEMSRVCW